MSALGGEPGPALGMATADSALRAALEAHDDPGGFVLDTTPQALLVAGPGLHDVRLRLSPLSRRCEPPPSGPHRDPTSPSPPPGFHLRKPAYL